MIVGMGNFVFVRQLKLIWQNQKINVKKNSLRETIISFQALYLYFAHYLRIKEVLLNCTKNLKMRLLNYIFLAREINKKKEMIVLIIFLGKESSMKPVVMTRNIYSFMNCGCLHSENSTKICLRFWMNSVCVHLEKRQVSQADSANTLICMMMKEYTRI